MGKHAKNETNKNLMKEKLYCFFKVFSKRLLELLFPEALVCIACGKELKDGDDRFYSLCARCEEKLPYRTNKYCEKCGAFILDGRLCKFCQIADYGFTKVLAPFDYSGIVRSMVLNYKDGGKTYLYRYIARHIAAYYLATETHADCMAYVPSTRKTIRKRGFDNGKKLAKECAKIIDIPLIDVLDKVRNTLDQTNNNRGERFANISGAFSLKKDVHLENKCVILLDDVVTTGATVSECSKQLLCGGAKEVIILSFARR